MQRRTVRTPFLPRVGIILIETALLFLLAAWVIPAGRGPSAAAPDAITFEESLSVGGVDSEQILADRGESGEWERQLEPVSKPASAPHRAPN